MSKITALTAFTSVASGDLLPAVDIDDTTMAATGTDKKITCTQLLSLPNNGFSTPANPATTTSTTLVMMGLGSQWALTPVSSGKVLVTICGMATTLTAIVAVTVGPRFGTGTAPVNGAAVTGSKFGTVNDMGLTPPVAAGNGVPFTFTGLLTLTPATAYWFDMAVATANASDAASLFSLMWTAVEIA